MRNIIIENDNLLVLRELRKNYLNKIDLIVIDPPYNTSINHIGYKDKDFKDGWVSFMKPRLDIGYSLLCENGVMFIHIDENELINLSKMCYDIFGINNVNILVWKKINKHFDKNRIDKPIQNIKSVHEYVLLCYKDKEHTCLKNMMQPVLIDNKWIDNLTPMVSILDNLGTTSSAKDEIAKILGSRELFATPKPLKLTKEFIRVATNKDSIVLDFFAGSGTTGHAVMDLNKEDKGKRKFILITNDENDICKKVTIPRISKAIDLYGYDEEIVFSKLSENE